MNLREIYQTALFQKSIDDIMDLLSREGVDLAMMKRTYKLRANLRTTREEKARRIANALWRRGAFGRI